ncbi:MAG: DUF3626 domain-containing protein [Caulobacteraceae bacterium]|nr:DUF3626 domain-containing protein [Caulobacteraceae bacterium]
MDSQLRALRHVGGAARKREAQARGQAVAIARRAGIDEISYDRAVSHIRNSARVIVHFHPDRCGRDGVLTAQALLDEGLYRNQFETGLSNGSLSAFAGGARDEWERALFGGAYHTGDGPASERPKYGALELFRFPDGPIPRFGSCYFVLRDHVKARTSFTFMGSEDPNALWSLSDIEHLGGVMAALLSEVEAGGVATPAWPPYRVPTLGVRNLTVERLFRLLAELPDAEVRTEPGRVLDTVIEAQVHGPLSLHDDVEAVVCDPSFQGACVGVLLERLGQACGLGVSWHGGFSLPASEVPGDFRGERMIPLAERIAGRGGILTAAVIGDAWRSFKQDPSRWADLAPEGEADFRRLWHTLVHCGAPAGR